MHPRDIEKTTFKISLSNFCYAVMPFGLKNVAVTYQRLMDQILGGMIRRNVEAYVDDMVVKSIKFGSQVQDLREFFQTLDKYKLKLNPTKMCVWCKGGKVLRDYADSKGN